MARPGAPVVDDVFGVVAHPHRRRMLEQLARGERRVSDLAEGMPVSRPAVSQHLRLMLELGVVVERRQGRERYYSLQKGRLDEVARWLARIDGFWTKRLDRLGTHLGPGS